MMREKRLQKADKPYKDPEKYKSATFTGLRVIFAQKGE